MLAGEGESVADREDEDFDAAIGDDGLVKLAQNLRRFALVLGIADAAGPEGVVDDDQAAGAEQWDDLLEVVVIVGFVGVDEGEVEGEGRFGEEAIEGVAGWGEVQFDFGGDSGLFPVVTGDGGVGGVDVTGE